MLCSNCKTRIHKKSNFCFKCGFHINQTLQSSHTENTHLSQAEAIHASTPSLDDILLELNRITKDLIVSNIIKAVTSILALIIVIAFILTNM